MNPRSLEGKIVTVHLAGGAVMTGCCFLIRTERGELVAEVSGAGRRVVAPVSCIELAKGRPWAPVRV
jgi:hypothetical protein